VNDKFAIARSLREIGILLKLKGENPFRARAYELGAAAVEELREELGSLIAERRLTELAGIGPALAATIVERTVRGAARGRGAGVRAGAFQAYRLGAVRGTSGSARP